MVMRKSLGQVESFVGVDISERWLDVRLLPQDERAPFSRDPQLPLPLEPQRPSGTVQVSS
jgi:hypothetical protein